MKANDFKNGKEDLHDVCMHLKIIFLYVFQPSSFPLKRDHWIFSSVCKNTWKQRYRKSLRKRPNSYTFVRCFCVCPHSDPIRENYLKTWQGGGWE